MTRKEYLSLALCQPVEWLAAAAAHPTPYMTKTHVRLILIAIRMKTKGFSHADPTIGTHKVPTHCPGQRT